MVIAPFLVTAAMALQPVTPRHGRGYAVASFAVAYHPANGPLYHRVYPALGGHSWDMSGGGGFYVTSGAAIEGEFLFGGIVAAPQRFSYFTSETYTEQARDVMLNALVRAHPAAARRIAIVAGGGYAWMHTSEVSITEIDSLGRLSPGTPRSDWWHGPTLTFALEAIAINGARAALAPSVRARVVKRPASDEGWNGLGAWTFQFGASLILR
jgi:hypothetical protein